MAEKPTYEELEQRLKELEKKTEKRKQAEDALKKKTHDLGERIKELNCLYGIANLIEKPGISLEEIFQGTANLIPPSWQYPEITCGRIRLEDREYLTDNFQETTWKQTTDIIVHDETIGNIEVFYLQEKPEIDEGPFLEEERSLIDAVAERLGRVIERKQAEESLRQYEHIVSGSTDMVALLDKQFSYLAANKTYMDAFGLTSEQLIGNTVPSVFGEEFFCKVIKPNAERCLLGEEVTCQDWFDFPIFGHRFMDITYYPYYSPDNKVVGFVVNGRDNTGSKCAEEALKESEKFLNAVFDSIQDGISVLDTNLNIVRVNQTMRKWYPHMLPLEGKRCYEVYHGRSNACEICPTVRALKTAKLEMEEVPLTQKGGKTGDLELFAFPMLDDSGKPVGVVEYVRNITERKRAEGFLKESEQLYRGLFENNYSAMLLINPETGYIFDANPSACAYYGYSKETLKKMNITEINMLPEKEVFEDMEKAKSEDRNYFNFRHRLSNGSIRDVEVFSGPITVRGKSLLCSIIHDISKRKRNEEERERLISELQKALDNIKTLKGLLPICASCKKIRDDKGYWNQIEGYIERHSDALFSHSLCPECMDKIYGDQDWYKK